MAETTFSDVLHEEFLRGLAGDRSFERGVKYFNQGRVRSLAQYGNEISATVQGNYKYTVKLGLKNGIFEYRCSCPVGMDGAFCKHGVATALAWIDEPPMDGKGARTTLGQPSMEDLQTYLGKMSKEELVKLILEQAMGDAQWRDRLLMQVSASQPVPDIRELKAQLSEAIAIDDEDYDGGYDSYDYGGYGYYGVGPEYFEKIDGLLDGVDALLKAGHGALVLEALFDVPMLMDENFEGLGECEEDFSTIVARIEHLHCQACAIAAPDPLELAEWLFFAEWRSDYGFFEKAAITYGEFLGKEGQAVYRELVDKQLEKYGPPPSPTARGVVMDFSAGYGRSQLLEMRESLMKATGDIEDLAALIQEDLSEPHRYLVLVELYRDNGLEDAALEWAVRALVVFPDSQFQAIQTLSTFAIETYWNRQKWDEAIAIAWDDFCRCPNLTDYQRLLKLAQPLQAVDEWRDRAIAYLYDLATHKDSSTIYRGGYLGEAGLLVQVLLWEGDNERAWKAAHQYKLVNPELWMQLVDVRGTTHPQDALDFYRSKVEPAIQTTCNDGYEKAVKMLKLMEPLMEDLGQFDEFQTWVNELSVTYKRKRNFTKLLKQEKFIS